MSSLGLEMILKVEAQECLCYVQEKSCNKAWEKTKKLERGFFCVMFS
jgi:hypothetical protein